MADSRLTPSELDEIKQACAKATPGPWISQRNPCKCGSCPQGSVWHSMGTPEQATVAMEIHNLDDAELMANSRQWLPLLVRELLAAQETEKYLRDSLQYESEQKLLNACEVIKQNDRAEAAERDLEELREALHERKSTYTAQSANRFSGEWVARDIEALLNGH